MMMAHIPFELSRSFRVAAKLVRCARGTVVKLEALLVVTAQSTFSRLLWLAAHFLLSRPE